MDTLSTLPQLTFKQLMTGGMPLGYWFALLIFFMIGATIYQGVKVSRGISNKPGSPARFKPKYYFTDPRNYLDFFVALLSAYVFLRLSDTLLGKKIALNIEWMLGVAVVLGLCWQFLADKLIDIGRKLFKKLFA